MSYIPLVSDPWAEGAEEGLLNEPHEDLPGSLCEWRVMRKSPLTRQHQYLWLRVQKEDTVMPPSDGIVSSKSSSSKL